MSETTTTTPEPEPRINLDRPQGIADILAKIEGDLPPQMIPDEGTSPRYAHETASPAEAPPESTPEPAAPAAPDPELEAAQQLRRDAEQWRNRAQVAEQRATEAARRERDAQAEIARSRATAEDSGYVAVQNAIEARTAERDRLKAELRTAADAGNYDRFADITSRIGEIGAEMAQLQRGKEEYEAVRNQQLREPARTQAPVPSAGQNEWTTVGVSREDFLRGKTAPTQEWLRKNDQYFTDPTFHNKTTGAHHFALAQGLRPDTPEYFRFVEEQLGMSQQNPNPPTPNPPARRNGAPPATPPSRSPNAGRANGGDLTITPEERRTAEWMGVDPALYARENRDLRSRGDIPSRRR